MPVPAFEAWTYVNYPACASAQRQLAGAQSHYDELNFQAYGPGYQELQTARALIAFTSGGGQDFTVQNPNNMEIVTTTIPPTGSRKVLIGNPPPKEASKQITSFAPLYTLDTAYQAQYAVWQKASVEGRIGNTITISSSSKDYDYSESGWSAAARASWSGWFRSVSAEASASTQTISIDTSSTDFGMEVSFVGVAAFGIRPGPWWQNGSLVSKFKNQLKPNHPDFFSDDGKLARHAAQVVLGFEPTVTLKMSADDYSRLKTAWQTPGVSASFGPFSFSGSASAHASKDDIHYDDAAASIKIGPVKSTMPVLLGVVSQKPGASILGVPQETLLVEGEDSTELDVMISDLAKFVRLAVPCDGCGEKDLQRLSDLIANDSVPCGFCGASVDVSSKEWRAAINGMADSLRHIVPIYR